MIEAYAALGVFDRGLRGAGVFDDADELEDAPEVPEAPLLEPSDEAAPSDLAPWPSDLPRDLPSVALSAELSDLLSCDLLSALPSLLVSGADSRPLPPDAEASERESLG